MQTKRVVSVSLDDAAIQAMHSMAAVETDGNASQLVRRALVERARSQGLMVGNPRPQSMMVSASTGAAGE